MSDISDIRSALDYLDCSKLNYQEWIDVGMALHSEGLPCEMWDEWSRKDPARYQEGGCASHWKSFTSSGTTIKTLFGYAQRSGWDNPGTGGGSEYRTDGEGRELSEGEVIYFDSGSASAAPVIDRAMLGHEKCPPCPANWDPVADVREYLTALFDPSDHVAYSVEAYEGKDGKFHPGKRACSRTAGRLLDELEAGRTIEQVFGQYNPEAGAWINHNPVDGQGAKKENITAYRYLLIESDSQSIDDQYTLMTAKGGLELPIAALLHSGNKSLHAIVRVDAASAREYAQRADRVYTVCEKNGLKVDRATKDPSRLSRFPGFVRGDKKQYLIATSIGRESYTDWLDYIETIDDDLPDFEGLDEVFYQPPTQAPPLIDGILRQGHKMLIAGPSKAGKSFALAEMCVAFAEGTKWLSWQCTQGRVLYINLELDRPSCVQRFIDIYSALGMPPRHLNNILIWHLRGNAVPLDKLAPRIIRRSRNENFIAVVIDPIYKVLTGDENSAQEMSKFCSYLDRIAAELHCAVIYCHHHSKGAQGQKSSTDRASGSGVFVRDPDAIMDWIELPMNDKNYEALENTRICIDMMDLITKTNPAYLSRIPDDETASESKMQGHARAALREVYTQDVADNTVDATAREARAKARRMTGWRTEMTLREFPKPDQTDIFFDYPIHHPDTQGRLKYLEPEGKIPSKWEKPPAKTEDEKLEEQIRKGKEKANKYLTRLQMEFINLDKGGGVLVNDLAKAVGTDPTSKKFLAGVEQLVDDLKYTKTKEKGDDGKYRNILRSPVQA